MPNDGIARAPARLFAPLLAALLLALAGPAAAEPKTANPGITVFGLVAVEDFPDKDPHADVFAEGNYPTAAQCGSCHQQIYREWASSNHAYASISPMFHKFEQVINELSSGTIGSFCVRCHQQIGTQRGEERWKPLWERSQIAREGITCVTCHRTAEQFYKVNGERRVIPGDISAPVTNTGTDSKLGEVIAQKDFFRIATTPQDRGNRIHLGVTKFDQSGKSEFCVSCHQVAVHPGIKLEVVWDQYRASPALAAGTTCQDCHMGKVPGRADGYAVGPSAVVNGKEVNPTRKHSNHAFYGPGYPIAHPGIFPHNPKAEKFSIEDWLKFDFRAGWGTPDFEDKVGAGTVKVQFPDPWGDRIDREEAREIVDENIVLLEEKRELRRQVMENGSHVDGPFFSSPPKLGERLRFSYRIHNTNPGHNMPSGSLGAQPELWVNVALISPSGKNVWESGYVDSHGDMADIHSLDVAAGKIKRDSQLVNLQTKFLTLNVKGTEREMYLPVNFDVDQIPHIRPATVPTSVLNHPPGIRMEARSIPPLGHRDASYSVSGDLLNEPGTWKLAFRMRSRAEPIYFMKFVKATPEMEQAMNEWMLDIHPYTVSFEVR